MRQQANRAVKITPEELLTDCLLFIVWQLWKKIQSPIKAGKPISASIPIVSTENKTWLKASITHQNDAKLFFPCQLTVPKLQFPVGRRNCSVTWGIAGQRAINISPVVPFYTAEKVSSHFFIFRRVMKLFKIKRNNTTTQ